MTATRQPNPLWAHRDLIKQIATSPLYKLPGQPVDFARAVADHPEWGTALGLPVPFSGPLPAKLNNVLCAMRAKGEIPPADSPKAIGAQQRRNLSQRRGGFEGQLQFPAILCPMAHGFRIGQHQGGFGGVDQYTRNVRAYTHAAALGQLLQFRVKLITNTRGNVALPRAYVIRAFSHGPN